MSPQPLVLLSILSAGSSVRVLDFGRAGTEPPGSSLNSALLVGGSSGTVPDRFVLCSSTRQEKLDSKGSYILLGENGLPWLAFSVWKHGAGAQLWMAIQRDYWEKLYFIEKPVMTRFWIHLCADVDTITGNLTVSLNGRPSMTVNSERLKVKKPVTLENHLEIGISRTSGSQGGDQQFFGVVTNVNIFSHGKTFNISLESMSKKPCENVGDVLAWSQAEFDWTGPKRSETWEDREVCWTSAETYHLLLSPEMTWREAKHTCSTLGGGNISEIQDNEQLKKTLAWVKRTERGCKGLWLPITDEAEEGVYRNIYRGDEEQFLPWYEGQPNGGTTESYVSLVLDRSSFNDDSENYETCVSCTLDVDTVFKLRGLCKDSFLGILVNSPYYRNYIPYFRF